MVLAVPLGSVTSEDCTLPKFTCSEGEFGEEIEFHLIRIPTSETTREILGWKKATQFVQVPSTQGLLRIYYRLENPDKRVPQAATESMFSATSGDEVARLQKKSAGTEAGERERAERERQQVSSSLSSLSKPLARRTAEPALAGTWSDGPGLQPLWGRRRVRGRGRPRYENDETVRKASNTSTRNGTECALWKCSADRSSLDASKCRNPIGFGWSCRKQHGEPIWHTSKLQPVGGYDAHTGKSRADVPAIHAEVPESSGTTRRRCGATSFPEHGGRSELHAEQSRNGRCTIPQFRRRSATKHADPHDDGIHEPNVSAWTRRRHVRAQSFSESTQAEAKGVHSTGGSSKSIPDRVG